MLPITMYVAICTVPLILRCMLWDDMGINQAAVFGETIHSVLLVSLTAISVKHLWKDYLMNLVIAEK